MHNMSKQFYDYIGEQLNKHFQKESEHLTSNRYYLFLPTNEAVKELYEVLKDSPISKPFSYTHSQEGSLPYETISLNYGQMKYVIAITNENTTIDFLVTLRNEMSEQKGEWKNTSLLFISNTLNDSIRGGSIDITSEGFPLHVKQLIGDLDKLVQNSALDAMEKEVIHHYLNNRLVDYTVENTSFLDFEEILGIINSNEILKTDYLKLRYFPDNTIIDYVKERDSNPYQTRDWKRLQKEIEGRLEENNRLHEDVDGIRLLGTAREQLVEKFDNGGQELMREDWYETDFDKIQKWQENVTSREEIMFRADNTKVELISPVNKHEKQFIDFWTKPLSTTAAGKRNWSILIFHPTYQEREEVIIHLPFDRNTSKAFLNESSAKTTETKGYSLVTTVELDESGATFQRVTYTHKNSAKSKYVFNIAVIAWTPTLLKDYSDSFSIITSSKVKRCLQITHEEETINIGEENNEHIELTANNQVVEFDKGATISFKPGILEEGETSLRFVLKKDDYEVPLEIKGEKLKRIPIKSQVIWNMKREKQTSFKIDEDMARIEFDNIPYSTHESERIFYRREQIWLDKGMRKATISYNEMVPEELALPKLVETTYSNFLDALQETKTIPSLTYYTDEITEKAYEFIEAFISEIEGIEKDGTMTPEQRAMFYLGTLRENETIFMTPFSPLNVAYQLELNKETKGQYINRNISDRLVATSMLPYMMDETGAFYRPHNNIELPEWHGYLPQKNVTVGQTNMYLAKVVEEKITQFTDHYDYLFNLDPTSSILLNVVHIPNDLEILKGIVHWCKNEIKRKGSLDNLRSIDITIYNNNESNISAFDIFNMTTDVEIVENRLGLNLKVNDFLKEDILSSMQRTLNYTKRNMNDDIKYSHITFYKMKSDERIVRQVVNEMPSSLNLNGLFTTNVFKKYENGYRIGFGVAESNYNRTLLTKFATIFNELAVNMFDKGQNPYHKNIALAVHSDNDDQDLLNRLYEQSNWVTFIDPTVDLKYFKDTYKNLVIVHYSDQYSSSNNYDAITITDKVDQYYYVLEEFLNSQNVKATDKEIETIIQTFNTFNGEWLLRAVQGRSHDKREKMSMVSAIKLSLDYFDKPDIMWVPLSMEEIVRVTGSIGLSKKAGLFSGKTIGSTGNCSDDLLMMGLEVKEDKLFIHMYPVEVKIGFNQSGVIDKGIKQVEELKKRLTTHLEEDNSFDGKFLRNFFSRLFINNAEKMVNNQIWPDRDYRIGAKVVDKLLNDEFEIVNNLQADFGKGLIISFKKDAIQPTRNRRQGVVILEFPEQLGYSSLPVSMNGIRHHLFIEHLTRKPIIEEKNERPDTKPEVVIDVSKTPEEGVVVQKRERPEVTIKRSIENDIEIPTTPINEESSVSVRPLLGTTNDMKIKWEFDHSGLSNRHLVIGGRSGQGKTYFIQALLNDLAKMNQSAIVIDYSSSYTRTQLDPIFIEKMGSKLKERIVYHEGFPLNPFILREKEVSGITAIEKPAEAARRIVDVFASVYRNFGAQQKSALYDATKNGIDRYGKKMTLELLLEELESLENYSNQVLISIASRLVQFVDIDPFDYETEAKWEEYFAPGGNITIIQLAGYDQDEMKRLLAEFILWDIWYYSQEGTKDKAIPVILDEAQNLDFSEGSPAAKILREGRKFGWSAWFATQSFNNFAKDELDALDNAGTKVYFNPAESEIKVIASRSGNANPDELRMLKKGQCLVLGQFKQADKSLTLPTYHIVNVPAMDASEREED